MAFEKCLLIVVHLIIDDIIEKKFHTK